MEFKKGDKIRVKKHPELRGKIKDIKLDYHTGKNFYIPDFGGWYLAEELEYVGTE